MTRANQLLSSLQRGLEGLYRLDPAPEVTDFLLPEQLAGARREQLLVLEDDGLHLGLAIDRNALYQLSSDRLAQDNLPSFSLVVEGVSHFLYLVHRARQQQQTSVLELELQSEIDKYVAALLLVRRCPSLVPERLRRELYSGYLLLEDLSIAEQHRYSNANGLANRYARHLEERFVRTSRLSAMVGELRRFYRLSCWAKQAHIA